MKYHNNLMKGSQDIEQTSSGLTTDRYTDKHIDQPVQSNMPLFFEGGHNKS
jgi:hypothetical protein